MSDALSIVQFTHPGSEHGPDKGQKTKSWNNGDHKRKFLSSKGVFVGPAGGKEKGDLCFWGEWEPPSKIINDTFGERARRILNVSAGGSPPRGMGRPSH
jgi:hypothetical protein